ncbi:hypothetical protein PF005_g21500 [Phytophthora fragariae]|uniref:SGNH hydrolase-type esterase domain-containing protein n=1 Tax=Phytophthora fragariae TaxID=53985 RepID=A0A6A3WH28_9STRA|nr:hypothetical protein PF003_g27871 [Phytophthora fragariae]KAE8927322.1 hypothetical protein PF009_g22507 [Phytophthora fragariae]KAE9084548.1 hypothetical protein PF007_g21480 [Phytophthora fragariae]KAE9110311.1 hypothetical protein PF006_g20481 [Phytophthora fragariae]KAE9184866.1 hypothetical protein PF005_g21500 [Phytophthora fragariae]
MPRVTLCSLVPIVVAFAAVYFASHLGVWEQAVQTICSKPAATRPTLLLLGDSLTEQGVDPNKSGWVALLQNRYQRSADVLPRGLSGYNTKWFIEFALPVIKRELSSGGISPSLITLWLGANDAALTDGPSSRQHVHGNTFQWILTPRIWRRLSSHCGRALRTLTCS